MDHILSSAESCSPNFYSLSYSGQYFPGDQPLDWEVNQSRRWQQKTSLQNLMNWLPKSLPHKQHIAWAEWVESDPQTVSGLSGGALWHFTSFVRMNLHHLLAQQRRSLSQEWKQHIKISQETGIMLWLRAPYFPKSGVHLSSLSQDVGSHSPCDYIRCKAKYESTNEGAYFLRCPLPPPPLFLETTLPHAVWQFNTNKNISHNTRQQSAAPSLWNDGQQSLLIA